MEILTSEAGMGNGEWGIGEWGIGEWWILKFPISYSLLWGVVSGGKNSRLPTL
ncbi:hypothetical protein [Nostoc sp.]|uniref:hypothetical protein n=1 Tax=Nostoc sp. TaxID=1180 RepID=UPI002FFB9FD8